MEERDLFDKNRIKTGEIIVEGENIPEEKYILIISVIIKNESGEFLIQKRTKSKNGKWASTGGHAQTGETSLEAMLREIKEELGLRVMPEEIELVISKKIKKAFVDIYYMKKEIEIKSLMLQTEEVEEVQWMTKEEIQEKYEKQEFFEPHYINIKQCLECLKEEDKG